MIKQKVIRKQSIPKGQSLVELMVGLGIASSLALVVAVVAINQGKTTKSLQARSTTNELTSEVVGVLGTTVTGTSTCKAFINGGGATPLNNALIDVTTTSSRDLTAIKLPGTSSALTPGLTTGKYGSTGTIITRVSLSWTGAPTGNVTQGVYQAVLTIYGTKPPSSSVETLATIPFTLNDTDFNGRADDCQAGGTVQQILPGCVVSQTDPSSMAKAGVLRVEPS